jgi:biotin carboxyl carrier protein
VVALRSLDGTLHEVVPDVAALEPPGPPPAVDVDLAARSVAVNLDGITHTFAAVPRSERWAPTSTAGHGHALSITAPFPAVVASVEAAPGQHVGGGDPVIVIEAMKMLHTLTAAGPGVVAEIRVAPGDRVESHQVLATFEPVPDEHEAAP